MNALGSPLGASAGPEASVGDGGGQYVSYQHGVISYSAATGAHSVYGYADMKWAAQGRERGKPGVPAAEKWSTRTAGSRPSRKARWPTPPNR